MINAEITIVQGRFMRLYSSQRDYLKAKPAQLIEDLLHEDLSLRAAAEINRAACLAAEIQCNVNKVRTGKTL